MHEFGVVQIDTILKTRFHLFNYGDAVVNFRLSCLNRSINRDFVKITPITGEVKPTEKLEIEVEVKVGSIGDNEMFIMYNDNIGNSSSIQIEEKDIFKLTYNCEIEVIQVEQIIDHNFGHLFGIHHIWDLLEIDRYVKMFTGYRTVM